MKPKAQGPHDEGFLEYLEDIIGTDKYVEKIDEAYKEWVKCVFVILWKVYIFRHPAYLLELLQGLNLSPVLVHTDSC